MKNDPELTKIMKDLHPVLVSAYSTYPHQTAKQLEEAGEWPKEGVHYYGFPQFPDTYVTYYRKDLFCNEKEAAKFQETFNQKLPCTYEDWQQVDWDVWQNIGKHFQRKKGEPLGDGVADDDFYGIAYQAGVGYDFSSMQVNAFIWQNGGSIWDETKAPEGQAAGRRQLRRRRQVVRPVSQHAALHAAGGEDRPDGHLRGPGPVHAGQGRGGDRLGRLGRARARSRRPRRSPTRPRSASAPGTKKADGTIDRTGNIGGQPFVLTTWNSPEVNEAALEVVKWWLKPETQKKFVANGGQSGLRSVMADPEYDSLRPWNRAHKEMLDWQRDVWHIPEFFELLTQQQQEFDKAITGQSLGQAGPGQRGGVPGPASCGTLAASSRLRDSAWGRRRCRPRRIARRKARQRRRHGDDATSSGRRCGAKGASCPGSWRPSGAARCWSRRRSSSCS